MVGDRPVLTVSSIFRDSTGYVSRYFDQIADLEEVVGRVQLVIAEGDSTDLTHQWLKDHCDQRAGDDVLLKVEHGGPRFASVDDPARWRQIAMVCNAVAEFWDQTTIYVESDLTWTPHTMVRLLEDLEHVEAVAPMCMHQGRFYDIWGHRGLDGIRFTMAPPYHADLERSHEDLVEIGSAGSCVAMRPDVARRARFGEDDCMVGLGHSIRDGGGHLWLDPRVAVYHP